MTTNVPPFRLDLRSTNGPRQLSLREQDADIPIHEWTTWLRVRSDVTGFVAPAAESIDDDSFTGFVPPVFEDDGLAVLVVTRPQQDFTGQTIGLFHSRLDREQLERLRAAVEGVAWAELPRPVGGDVTAPDLWLRHERGSLLIERRFNARSGNFLAAIAPLMRVLEGELSRARKSPSAALELTVAGEPNADDPLRWRLRVKLRNRGMGGFVLTDPRVPRAQELGPRLELRIGELVSPHAGVDPYEWTTLPLPPLDPGASPSLILGAGRGLILDVDWRAPKPGAYLIRVKWEDYEGPIEAVPGQTPFLPLPERGPSFLGSGPYPIRGANLASLRIEVLA